MKSCVLKLHMCISMSSRERLIAVAYTLATAIDAFCIGMMLSSDSDTALMWAVIAIPLSVTILHTIFAGGDDDAIT